MTPSPSAGTLSPAGSPPARIRVLVVDDSVVIRRLVSESLANDPQIEVVGVASNGQLALERVRQLSPDVITLDVEMPEMDGLATLRRLRVEHPRVRTIMFSTLTERGAATTLEALTLGASDYVTKPANLGSLDQTLGWLRGQLLPKIKQFFLPPPPVLKLARAAPKGGAAVGKREVVVIGASTGGPSALGEVFSRLPNAMPVPVLVVQHMPPLFTRLLAERLQAQSGLTVREAQGGEALEAGHAYLAPGDFHLVLRRQGGTVFTALNKESPENSCRPAVDVLFRSAAEAYGGAAVGVILTGMGQDGLRGIELLRAKGAYVIAQDEASSVVWGMPGAVARAGLADATLPLDQIVLRVMQQLS